MLSLALLLQAQATPPAAMLPGMLDGGAQGALVCSPLEDVAAAMRGNPMLGMMAAGAPPETQRVLGLLEPGALAEAGVDAEGALRLLLDDEIFVSLPFSGTEEQAAALLEQASGVPPIDGGGGRWLAGAEGALRVRLSPTHLEMAAPARRTRPGAAATVPSAALAAGLPQEPGCAVIFGLPEGAPDKPRPSAAALYVPFGGGQTMIRLAMPAAPGLESSGAEIRYGTSVERPLALLSVSASPEALLQAQPVQRALAKRGVDPASLADLPVTLLPGMSAAVFGDLAKAQQAVLGGLGQDERPDLGLEVDAVLPAARDNGRPLRPRQVARRARTGLRRQGVAVSREGGRGLSVALDPKLGPLHVRVQRDRLLLSTSAERADALDAGAGTPWVTDAHAAAADGWAVALSAQFSAPMLGGEARFAVATRSQGDVLEVMSLSEAPSGQAVMVMGALTALGNQLTTLFEQVSEELDGAVLPAEDGEGTPAAE